MFCKKYISLSVGKKQTNLSMPCGCYSCCSGSNGSSPQIQQKYFTVDRYLKADDHLYHNTTQSMNNARQAFWMGSMPSTPCCVPAEHENRLTAELYRFSLNDPHNYLGKSPAIIQALPNEIPQLKKIAEVTTSKNSFVGEVGSAYGPPLPLNPRKTTFHRPPLVEPPKAQGPVPDYLANTRDPLRMQSTLDRPFEWITAVPQNKIAADRYSAMRDDSMTKMVLMGVMLGVLFILPVIPP